MGSLAFNTVIKSNKDKMTKILMYICQPEFELDLKYSKWLFGSEYRPTLYQLVLEEGYALSSFMHTAVSVCRGDSSRC